MRSQATCSVIGDLCPGTHNGSFTSKWQGCAGPGSAPPSGKSMTQLLKFKHASDTKFDQVKLKGDQKKESLASHIVAFLLKQRMELPVENER